MKPLIMELVQSPLLEFQEEGNKYNMRREKKLHSNFVLKQEKKQQKHQHRQQQNEPGFGPDPDPLWGLRVHFWVLVLAGSRSVEQDFFIEPLTGNCFPTDHIYFLGVESMWNELNLYVNMQDCTKGCQDLLLDPEDQSHWEPLLYGTTSKKKLQATVLKRQAMTKIGIHQDQDEENGPPYAFEMPQSWCNMIDITDRDLEMCWPGGFKETHYKQALVENYIPYFCPDGVITRLILYQDQNKTHVQKVKEWFQNRTDLLTDREKSEGFTTEQFKPGRNGHLIFHRFNTSLPEACPSPETSDTCVTPERVMLFGPYRVDGLVRRVECGNEMIETFQKRHDFLFQRHTLFGNHPPISEPSKADKEKRPILKVVEQFHRNQSIAAIEDIAECVFLLSERRIEVTYHLEESHFIAAKRSFDKPIDSTEPMKAGDFTKDMITTFQVEPSAHPKNLQHLYQILQKLLIDEQRTIWQIRNSQKSVQSLVLSRAEEEKDIKLETCPWTITGTSQARQRRQRVMLLGEELRWLEQQQKDLLAPVLIRLNGSTALSPDQAHTVYYTCLQDFKSCMVQHAQLIQQRYEEDTQVLEEQQRGFQESSNSPGKTGHTFLCSDRIRQIQVAQKRLQMHKECAPQKYKALEQKLRADPRLSSYLKGK